MKRVLEGRIYDTEKSVLICKICEGNKGDFAHFEAELYKTPKSGRFFLAGEGGPMTIFRKRVDQNSWSGSSGIIPISGEEALRYAERHASVEVVEKYFTVEEA